MDSEIEKKPDRQVQEFLLQFFEYEDQPPAIRKIARPFAELAHRIATELPRNPERTTALRDLMNSRNAAIRALVAVSTFAVFVAVAGCSSSSSPATSCGDDAGVEVLAGDAGELAGDYCARFAAVERVDGVLCDDEPACAYAAPSAAWCDLAHVDRCLAALELAANRNLSCSQRVAIAAAECDGACDRRLLSDGGAR